MSKTLTLVRIVADYQMFGEEEALVWAQQVFDAAKAHGKIVAYEVTNVSTGVFGLKFISFTVDASLPGSTNETFRRVGRELLNDIVGDTDVTVRLAAPLDE